MSWWPSTHGQRQNEQRASLSKYCDLQISSEEFVMVESLEDYVFAALLEQMEYGPVTDLC